MLLYILQNISKVWSSTFSMPLEGHKINFKFQNFNNMYFDGIRLDIN